jgi:hypothetical protein
LNATSSLTFVVLGQLKEVIQILLAMIVFHENVTTRGVLGIYVYIYVYVYVDISIDVYIYIYTNTYIKSYSNYPGYDSFS